MNTKDFIVLPWGKPGNSIKLKYKNARELRMEKVRLELETQEMAQKLQEFRSTQSKEKEEKGSSGYHWKSGKVSKLGNHSHVMSQSKGSVIKLSAGKVKLKLLKEQIQEPVKQPVNNKMANSFGSEKAKTKGQFCGQCEKKAALLVCLECGEDYCSGCFAKSHQKGALRLHRTTLLQAKSQILSSVLDAAHRFIKEAHSQEPQRETNSTNSTKEAGDGQHEPRSQPLQGSSSEVEITTNEAECTKPRERLLGEGSFDEEGSARSFQEVLSQWRTGHHLAKEKQSRLAAKADSLEECEVQTNLKMWSEPITIEFKEDSLSYMEKLWLKKHRRTPEEQLLNVLPNMVIQPRETTTSEKQIPQRENKEEDSDVEETEVQQLNLFLPVEDLNTERPEPSLKIVELDDTYEEEFEESGNTAPYKVELAEADRQQSYAFHDYQKNGLPYELHTHQLRIFNKGKTELLHLCLRNSSTSCKNNSKGRTSNTDFDSLVDLDVYSSDSEKSGEIHVFERKLKEKRVDIKSNQESDGSCVSPENKDYLPSVDLEKRFIEEELSQDIKRSLEFNNLNGRPYDDDSKITPSLLLLQDIALRSQPTAEQYQGLQGFFIFDKNERVNLLPSHSLECSCPNTRITLAEDREWIPDDSLSANADNAIVLGVLQSTQNPTSDGEQLVLGQKPWRPSTVNLPLLSSVKRSSSCLSSSHLRSRSAAARSLSRAASEISEIEYIDRNDQYELFLDDTADQQTLDSLEKELNGLSNLSDPSEKIYSLTSEELPAFGDHSADVSQMSTALLETSEARVPCGVEELSSSGRNTEIQSLFSFCESSTDEEEEEFLDKHHVIMLPWSKSTS
ncbi:zinc finger B-box domain-containing protein 1 [Nycticebus coucang]|uniref:zinc finger B-box domain-containing protein 1 n=1 Tax=Nycticebus coucang TaxID=9470 RepID=UPI00234D7515|nr:zinc finger B-box domain-containing protein 1 [Nycticebus coucang]